MGCVGRDKRELEDYLRNNDELWESLGLSGCPELELHELGMGEHNLNYWFADSSGRRFVLRVNVASQPFHVNQVAYEFEALRSLGPSGRTPEPLYLDDSPKAPGKGALVIGFCEGSELDFDHVRPGDLRCVAQIMADVHAVPVDENCGLYRPRDPLCDLFEECLERFEMYRASAFEDARITRWARAFIAAAEPMTRVPCERADCMRIVNTETLPSHFLIPGHSANEAAAAGHAGRFCANPGSFVDWERPIIGEVAQDVAYFVSPTTTFWDSEFLFPASDVDAFVEDYWRAVDGRFPRGNFDERFRAFRTMTALRSVTWCCRALTIYGRRGGAAGVHTTDKTARKLPIYLSDDFMEMLAAECFGL